MLELGNFNAVNFNPERRQYQRRDVNTGPYKHNIACYVKFAVL